MLEKNPSLEHGGAQNVAEMTSETCAKAEFGKDLQDFPYEMLEIGPDFTFWGATVTAAATCGIRNTFYRSS